MNAPVRRYYSALAASKYLAVSYSTVMRALKNDGTDRTAYPPPLTYDGRHGEGGKYQISEAQLDEWSKSLGMFG